MKLTLLRKIILVAWTALTFILIVYGSKIFGLPSRLYKGEGLFIKTFRIPDGWHTTINTEVFAWIIGLTIIALVLFYITGKQSK